MKYIPRNNSFQQSDCDVQGTNEIVEIYSKDFLVPKHDIYSLLPKKIIWFLMISGRGRAELINSVKFA